LLATALRHQRSANASPSSATLTLPPGLPFWFMVWCHYRVWRVTVLQLRVTCGYVLLQLLFTAPGLYVQWFGWVLTNVLAAGVRSAFTVAVPSRARHVLFAGWFCGFAIRVAFLRLVCTDVASAYLLLPFFTLPRVPFGCSVVLWVCSVGRFMDYRRVLAWLRYVACTFCIRGSFWFAFGFGWVLVVSCSFVYTVWFWFTVQLFTVLPLYGLVYALLCFGLRFIQFSGFPTRADIRCWYGWFVWRVFSSFRLYGFVSSTRCFAAFTFRYACCLRCLTFSPDAARYYTANITPLLFRRLPLST